MNLCPVAGVVPLSLSQCNILAGALQTTDPSTYLVAKEYRFHGVDPARLAGALREVCVRHPLLRSVLRPSPDPTVGAFVLEVSRSTEAVVVEVPEGPDGPPLSELWRGDPVDGPLVRFTLFRRAGATAPSPVRLLIEAHHLVVDAGSLAVIEDTLAVSLSGGYRDRSPVSAGVRAVERIRAVHMSDRERCAAAERRFRDTVRAELDACPVAGGGAPDRHQVVARRGCVKSRRTLTGRENAAVRMLAATCRVPVTGVLIAAVAAVAAADRGAAAVNLVHTLDPRYLPGGEDCSGEVTCLVNSVMQILEFSPFISIRELVTAVDRGYVRARRRAWFREEQLHRELLRSGMDVSDQVAVNILRQRVAPTLAPFLAAPPEITAVGPVEGTVVQFLLADDSDSTGTTVAVWESGTPPSSQGSVGLAGRIVRVLVAFASDPDAPAARAAGAWEQVPALPRVDGDQSCWTGDPAFDRERLLADRPGVGRWLRRLAEDRVPRGAVVVFGDDGTEDCIDLVLATHLAGAGYSPCATGADVTARARQLREAGITVGIVDLVTAGVTVVPAGRSDRIAPHGAGDRIAYVLATSGTTGTPKLVPVSHRSLAVFLSTLGPVYRWGPGDRLLECVGLTSDISVEVVFGAVVAGASVRRGSALGRSDAASLLAEAIARGATVLDIPTAVWSVLARDPGLLSLVGDAATAGLRQVVIGGEEVDAEALASWRASPATGGLSLVSTYGPTETTVIVTSVALAGPGTDDTQSGTAVGTALSPDTVHSVFGEVVVTGDTVSAGYLPGAGPRSAGDFGRVRVGGRDLPAFATGDRVRRGHAGVLEFAGRRDELVKIGGRFVDLARLRRKLNAIAGLAGVAVGVEHGRAVVRWKPSAGARESGLGPVASEVRRVLRESGAGAWSSVMSAPGTGGVARPRDWSSAEEIAAAWSGMLGMPVEVDDSLTVLGVGSLDIIRLLQPTRRLLGDDRLSVRDLLAADNVAALVDTATDRNDGCVVDAGGSVGARDFAGPGWADGNGDRRIRTLLPGIGRRLRDGGRHYRSTGTVVVLGAGGTVGSGFAVSGTGADLVLVARGPLVGVTGTKTGQGRHVLDRIGDLTAAKLRLILGAVRDSGRPAVVVNGIGDTSLTATLDRLTLTNVDLAETVASVCRDTGFPLLHLSSASAGVTSHPYNRSKRLGERRVLRRTPGSGNVCCLRLPRILPVAGTMGSTDVLVSVAAAVRAVGAVPAVDIVEDVLRSEDCARYLLRFSGRGSDGIAEPVTVPGHRTAYVPLLRALPGSGTAPVVPLADWLAALQDTTWPSTEVARWAVVDEWARLAGESGDPGAGAVTGAVPDGPAPSPGTVERITQLITPEPGC
ncbi:AMP-binding protein [uncultured Corynebacterium sp.]|uniref:AMP-binding protein n=1 Tax=uncultured Corynebacterium sp. TaxID=159447 RepID=UPI0025F74DD2|nr:AMP-binding protein [uncultured Corynebacterium sp.]